MSPTFQPRARFSRMNRKNAHFSTAQMAEQIGREEKEVIAWENGSGSPTFSQLTKFAKICKRPVAVFYLPEPPRDFTILKDFRRLPNSNDSTFSPALAYLIRICRERQGWLTSYMQGDESEPLSFVGSISPDQNVREAGQAIRSLLGVTINDQLGFKNNDDAFRQWRDRCEELGVCVFVASQSNVSTEEMRGFALTDRVAPIVVINGQEKHYAPRTFTLLHELVHIFVGSEGVSNLDLPSNPRTPDQRLEVFCNAVAAEVLVPTTDFRQRAAQYISSPLK